MKTTLERKTELAGSRREVERLEKALVVLDAVMIGAVIFGCFLVLCAVLLCLYRNK